MIVIAQRLWKVKDTGDPDCSNDLAFEKVLIPNPPNFEQSGMLSLLGKLVRVKRVGYTGEYGDALQVITNVNFWYVIHHERKRKNPLPTSDWLPLLAPVQLALSPGFTTVFYFVHILNLSGKYAPLDLPNELFNHNLFSRSFLNVDKFYGLCS